MDVRLPDGTIIANVPEGTTKADLVAKLQRNGMAVPAEWLAPAPQQQEAPKEQPRTLADQIGLTLRAGVKGAAALPALGADALGGLANAGLALAGSDFRFKPTAQALDSVMTKAGLPEPRTPLERIASSGAELMSGAGAAAKAAELGSRAVSSASPVAREVLSRLAADPTQQIVSAGAAGIAGQQAKESGANALGEFISAAGGGVLGAGALGAARAGVNGFKSLIPQQQTIQLNRVDQAINVSLQNSGIDPATVTPAMRSALRQQVGKAMSLGGLDEKAVARLADYVRLNMTPTRGRLTLNPLDVTQEQNASKLAAAIGATDAQLPNIASDNNARLLGHVDAFNPIADRFLTGQRAMAPIQATDRALKAGKEAAYSAADQMAGGDIPLQRGPLNAIYEKLQSARKLRFVPEQIMGTIDDVLNDARAPFTVNELDSLKTMIATAQRGTQDGNVKAALKIVRDHLDSMPLTPEKRTFGGNQLVTEQGAKFLQQQDAQAGNLKAALDEARAKNFSWMRWRESAPAIEAAVNDANPETFVRNFIRNQNADARDVAKAARVINTSEDARNAVRSEIIDYLKGQAIGKGNNSATGNFSAPGWRSALDGINIRKLELFFDANEIEQLRAIGRVGAYETFQPRGSAVNNSNTAAGVGGLLAGITQRLKPVANKIPLGDVAITNPLQNITLSVMQRGATNVPKSLLLQNPNQARSLLDPMILPAAVGTGLLSTQ